MAHFVSAAESGSVLGRIEGTELALACQSHFEVDSRKKWIADNGTTNMFIGDSRNLFKLKPTPVCTECV